MIEKAKIVTTEDHQGNVNGWLMELFKDGDKTLSYLTVTIPGAFKGFHLHRIRSARYICLKGKIKITTYTWNENNVVGRMYEKDEFILLPGDRLSIPNNVATGLENIGELDAWLINYPDPAYDPELKDEQVEYTEEELLQGVRK